MMKQLLSNHSGKIGFLLCFITLLLTLAPMAIETVAAQTENPGSKIIVSLGDSYSSGEGIEPFFGQNASTEERIENPDWVSHRSEKSWSSRLTLDDGNIVMGENRDVNWFFAAASGAETKHLKGKQYIKYNIDGYKDSYPMDPQLNIFSNLPEGQKAEYVTVTIGGNDAQFAKIIETAAYPHPFNPNALQDKLDTVWHSFYNDVDGNLSIQKRLKQAYQNIQDAAGTQAKIIVAGYPKLLDPNGCLVLFSDEDAKRINESVVKFNYEIYQVVQSCKAEGMNISFVSVEKAFETHGAYADDPYIHRVYFKRKAQDVKDGFSSYSVHPNDKGAQAYADCVQKEIDRLEALENPLRETSENRDVVLVLDISGSMTGEPLTETKEAAVQFVETVLKEDASIGIVTYHTYAQMVCDFTKNKQALLNTIESLETAGSTNIEDGLVKAEEMFQNSTAKKKIIVLMSDGSPNEGKVGDSLIEYANTLKDDNTYIYTLGFFYGYSGGQKSEPQLLMEAIASEGCHYEVTDAENLVFFFGDIADQINGQKYIYVRIACPVDVTVKHNGQTLCSKEDSLNIRTDYGSLTFEENQKEAEDSADNRVKILRLKEGEEYDIQIEGNGRGFMDYTIGFMDENGEYSDLRKFKNIKITKRTVVDTVAEPTNTSVLKVDEDGDGSYDLTYKAGKNEKGELVDNSYVLYLVLGGVALVLVAVAFILVKKRKKAKQSA